MESVADIALEVTYAGGGADWVLENGDLKLDYGIRSTVLASLFSDARAPDPQQVVPGQSQDPRGVWWDTPSRRYGSLLWLLDRAAIRDATETLARGWITSALAWLTELKIAAAVSIQVTRNGENRLDIGIVIDRSTDVGWRGLWDAEGSAVVETATATLRILSRG